jgi:N-acetylmuramoyl-L-alanine amidase
MERLCVSFVLLTLLVLPASLWAKGAETRYRETAAAFHDLRRAKGVTPAQWRGVAGAFLRIYTDHPAHRRGADSLFSGGLALRAARRAGGGTQVREEALVRFQQFVNRYPRHRLADDSLIHIAELFGEEPGDTHRAYLTYRQVQVTYPAGDQIALARRRAAALETAGRRGSPGKARIARNSAKHAGAKPGRKEEPTSTVKRLLFSSLADFTRVILTTDAVVAYDYSRLPPRKGKPERLYIDLKNTRPLSDLAPEHAVGDGVVERIRIGPHGDATTRVVFDLKRMARFEVKELHLPYEKKIIVDLYPKTEVAEAGSPRGPARQAVAAGELAAMPSLRNTLGLKVRKLIIDPGHGGHDPGAVAFGLREKHVALRLSYELRDVFRQKRPDIQVELTRENDIFIPLGKRPAIAKRKEADLFVSIHLNAHEQERFFGIETYFLNLTTDASALRVAARENATTEKQIGDLNAILTDLLRDTNILESNKLARSLQASLIGGLQGSYPVRDLGVKQAPFMVLIGAEMPSVLVEAGFITNRKENRRLRSAAYLRHLAQGIYEGLRKYIQEQTFALESPRPPRRIARRDS